MQLSDALQVPSMTEIPLWWIALATRIGDAALNIFKLSFLKDYLQKHLQLSDVIILQDRVGACLSLHNILGFWDGREWFWWLRSPTLKRVFGEMWGGIVSKALFVPKERNVPQPFNTRSQLCHIHSEDASILIYLPAASHRHYHHLTINCSKQCNQPDILSFQRRRRRNIIFSTNRMRSPDHLPAGDRSQAGRGANLFLSKLPERSGITGRSRSLSSPSCQISPTEKKHYVAASGCPRGLHIQQRSSLDVYWGS